MKRKLLILTAFVGAMFVLSIGVSAVAWNPGGPECVGVDLTQHPDCIPTTTTYPTTTTQPTTPTDTTPTETTPTTPPEATTTTGTVPTPPVEAGTTPKAEKAAKRAKAVASSPGNESLQVAQLGG